MAYVIVFVCFGMLESLIYTK